MNGTIAFVGLCIICLVICILYFKRGMRLSKVCTERVNARIIKVEHLLRDRKREYIPVYGFRVNGVDYETRGSSTNSKRRYHEGDESFVIYNPEKPNECLIEGKNACIKAGFIFAFLCILFAVFAIFIR